jgi:hypothetical protein
MTTYDLISPGKYEAKILEAKEATRFAFERVTEVIWEFNGFILTDKFKFDDANEKKKENAWKKMKALAAAIGLPEVIDGGRSYNELFLLPGKECVIEVSNFTADNGNTYHYVSNYMAFPVKKPTAQVQERPKATVTLVDDAIPF